MLSHNKTLAAQLYGELRQFLPKNAVEYFVSYYDYYQPEAYVPSTDVYIEKDASINQDIESLRLRATSSLMERDDVVIVATVSAIYGLGDPVEYRKLMVTVRRGEQRGRDEILAELVRIQYGRNDASFEQGTFRVRGDSSRSSRRMPNRRSASSSGATKSSGSPRSTRSPATPSRSSISAPSIRLTTSSPSAPRSSAPSRSSGRSWRSACSC